MILALLEAAARALLLALLVGSGLVLLRVGNVVAQKLAWGLVLLAAVAMPLAMRWPLGLSIPLPALFGPAPVQPAPAPAPAASAALATAEAPPPALIADEPPSPRLAPRAHRTVVPARSAPIPAPSAAVQSAVPPPARAAASPAFHLSPALLGWLLYCTVLIALLGRLSFGLVKALRLWRAARPISPSLLPPGLATDRSALCLRSSPAVHTPVTVAAGVLLPADFAGWESEKLRIVLAHEFSHLRQGDFYLQLLAGLHAAIFWFSPLGWWLKRKLSDLSETISDRAGMNAASDGPSYAQVLLEFAALPRPTFSGVPMARTSNLSRRIERLLNDSSFRQAFAGGRLRALAATLLVPVALVAATAAVRVQAAGQAPEPPQAAAAPAVVAQAAPPAPVSPAAPVAAQEPTAPPAPAAAPAPPDADAPEPGARIEKEIEVTVDTGDDHDSAGKHEGDPHKRQERKVVFSYSDSDSKGGESWAYISNHGENINIDGEDGKESREAIKKARQLAGAKPFLWFKRDGKSYIVDDAATLAEVDAAIGLPHEIEIHPDIVIPKIEVHPEIHMISPEDLKKKMEEVDKAMDKLRAKLGDKATMQELTDLQQKLGDLQGKLGSMQGSMVVKMHHLDDQKIHIIEKENRIQVRASMHGASQEVVHAVIERSLKNGKARPVE